VTIAAEARKLAANRTRERKFRGRERRKRKKKGRVRERIEKRSKRSGEKKLEETEKGRGTEEEERTRSSISTFVTDNAKVRGNPDKGKKTGEEGENRTNKEKNRVKICRGTRTEGGEERKGIRKESNR